MMTALTQWLESQLCKRANFQISNVTEVRQHVHISSTCTLSDNGEMECNDNWNSDYLKF